MSENFQNDPGSAVITGSMSPNMGVATAAAMEGQRRAELQSGNTAVGTAPGGYYGAVGPIVGDTVKLPEWVFQFLQTIFFAVVVGFFASTFIWAVHSISAGHGTLFVWICAAASPILFLLTSLAFIKQAVHFVRHHYIGLAIIIALCWWAYSAIAPHHSPVQAAPASAAISQHHQPQQPRGKHRVH
jgi:hypothetical protein